MKQLLLRVTSVFLTTCGQIVNAKNGKEREKDKDLIFYAFLIFKNIPQDKSCGILFAFFREGSCGKINL